MTSSSRDRTLFWIVLFALLKAAAHALVGARYGFHRDELQLIADARHLTWGYVAYPPLTPFVARISLALFGDSLVALRTIAALVQSVVIVVAALFARTLGGGRFAMWIAALFVAIGSASLAISSIFEYVTFDVLWWVLIAFFVAKTLATDDPRWWLATGAAIGLGVETKYSIAFAAAGVVAATLTSPLLRRHLRTKWLWLGAALSIVIAAPNLLWQMQHGWISLEFLNHIHARDVRIGRADHFLLEQLYVPANPVSIPLWIAGIVGLLTSERLRRFRPLLFVALVPIALFIVVKGRGYYTAGVYPALIAAGAVMLEPLAVTRRRLAFAVAAVLVVLGLPVLVIAVPLAPVGSKAFETATRINGDFREELGWKELTSEVARAYQQLPPQERAHTAIFCSNYGEAGAIDLFGPAQGLPHPISPVNSFWLRGYGDGSARTVIVLGASEEDVRSSCRSVTRVGRAWNRYGVENEETRDHPEVFLCRDLFLSWPQIWQNSRSFG